MTVKLFHLTENFDGSIKPVVGDGEARRNLSRASRHPEMRYDYDLFDKVLESIPLKAEEIRRFRHLAKYPDFPAGIKRAMETAADLHEEALQEEKARKAAQRALANRARAQAHAPGNHRSPAEIWRDLKRVVGDTYPPKSTFRRGKSKKR